jgi:hypothetical protein
LKENGIDRGNIRIPFYSDDSFEDLYIMEAVVLNVNDQRQQMLNKLDRKTIFKKKVNKYYSETSFALPNVKVGSIIEYSYKSQMKHYGGLRQWIFQSDIPVILSSYDLTIVPNAEFAYTVYKSDLLPIDIKPNSKNGSIVFEMSNIPGLREEAFMRASRDYLQRVSFQFSGYSTVQGSGYGTTSSHTKKYTTTWKELATELATDNNFGSLINRKLPGVEAVQSIWERAASPFEKMRMIHDYVRSNFSWNHMYSKYADEGLKGIWEKKTGTTGELNLILINLLKTADLEVYPFLVCERDYGHVDTTYPYLNQFNNVVACVIINEKKYLLDATDRHTPSFMVPFMLLNTTGFIVDRKKPALIKVTDAAKKNTSVITLRGVIDETSQIKLIASVNEYDYARIEKKKNYIADKAKYRKDFFEPFATAQVDSFDVEGLENDSLPLRHHITMNYALNKAGTYSLLNYNLFTGLYKNPFITEQRFSDIDFGCGYSYVINGTFEIPGNMVPEALPKSMRMVTPDKSMALIREVSQNGNTLQVGVRIDIYNTEYPANSYPEVQAFYKQMVDVINEPIVLKPKS